MNPMMMAQVMTQVKARPPSQARLPLHLRQQRSEPP